MGSTPTVVSGEITALETVVVESVDWTLETVLVTAVDSTLLYGETEVETLDGVVVPSETCEVDTAVTDDVVPVVDAGGDTFVVEVVLVAVEVDSVDVGEGVLVGEGVISGFPVVGLVRATEVVSVVPEDGLAVAGGMGSGSCLEGVGSTTDTGWACPASRASTSEPGIS